MNSGRAGKRVAVPVVIVSTLALIAAAGYIVVRSRDRLPAPGSAAYEETTRRFYHGLASLQVGLLDDAKHELTRATELAPGEPAAWANLGLAHLRLGEPKPLPSPAGGRSSPQSADIALLQGQLKWSAAARRRLRTSVEPPSRSPRPLSAVYAGSNAEAVNSQTANDEAQRLHDQTRVAAQQSRRAAGQGQARGQTLGRSGITRRSSKARRARARLAHRGHRAARASWRQCSSQLPAA